jgi:hypothetical protein
MNIKLLSVMALAIFAPLQMSYGQDAPAVEKKEKAFADMTVAEVKKAMKKGKLTIIDVNGGDSYKSGHLPGAIAFVNLQKGDSFAKALPKDKDALIIAYCKDPT